MDFVDEARLNASASWQDMFEGATCERLETVHFPEYLPKQRWFAGKSLHIRSTRIRDWTIFDSTGSALLLVEVQFVSGKVDVYLMVLAMTFGDAAEDLRRTSPTSIIAPVISDHGPGVLHDGVFNDCICRELLSFVQNECVVKTRHGRIRGLRGKTFENLLGTLTEPLPVRRGSAEQSNTSILYGDRFILKMLRRQEPGLNPDAEIGRYLTEQAQFDRVPPFAGSIEYQPRSGESSTLAMLQGLIANEGDGWKWTIEELERYFETCSPLSFPELVHGQAEDPLELSQKPPSQFARDHVGIYLDSARTLGRRTAQLHLALASATDDPAFAAEPLTAEDFHVLLTGLQQHACRVFEVLKEHVPELPDEVVETAAAVLSRRARILDHFSQPREPKIFQTARIRVHGDYHLGQVLRVKTDFVILDFEGEPARPLADRRAKQCPLKDVAGILRSFSYAAYSSLINYTTRHALGMTGLEPWARLWERCVATEFLRAYRESVCGAQFLPENTDDFRKVLDVFLVDKALYEVLYELNARPSWVRIPLMGIMSLQL